jgi:hypothetical protein
MTGGIQFYAMALVQLFAAKGETLFEPNIGT